MSLRLTIVTVAGLVLVMLLNTSSSAFACGYHKSQCYPSTPVPTAVPVPPPTVATLVPVVVPVVIPVTPVSVVSVVQAVALPPATPMAQNLIGVKIEVCHFEPTTQQWEIRHHEQAGDRAVIEHGLCAQDRAPKPTPVPIAIVTESAPEAPVSTPSIELVDVPAMPEIVPSEPVVTPEVPPDVEIVPEPVPDEPSGVPVQIP